MSLHLSIITPTQIALEKDIAYVYLPGATGEIGILDSHEPLISVVRPGEVRYVDLNGKENQLVIGEGFVQVADNKIVVVVDIAMEADAIDVHNVEKAIEDAKNALSQAQQLSEEESARFEASMAKNLALLNFKKKRH